jgi:hypothetical protein
MSHFPNTNKYVKFFAIAIGTIITVFLVFIENKFAVDCPDYQLGLIGNSSIDSLTDYIKLINSIETIPPLP